MKKIHLFPTIILIVSVFLTLLPFLKPGLFDVHDPTSAFRLYTLVDTIKAGQFPAAWNNSLNFGYGYPLHLYYAPLFGYLGALVLPIFGSYEIAVKVALLIASLVGTTGIYNLLLQFGIYPSILGAIAFTYLPYRAGALYVRGSYAEFLAMSLLPWVLYFWSKPQKSYKVIASTAIFTALLLLSHNTLLILVVPIIILMIFLFQRKYLFSSILSLGLSLGLAAWFLMPVLLERSFVQVEVVARLTNFKDHFLALSQLWYSPWGYGGSTAGVAGDNMSFMIGKGQLLLSGLGALTLFYSKKWKLLILYISIVLVATYLSLSTSQFVWEKISVLSIIQFPWRTLAIIGVGISLLAGISAGLFPHKWQMLASLVFSFLIIYTNFSYFKPQEYRNYNNDILSSASNLGPLVKNKIPEYLPTWMPTPITTRQDDGLTRTPIQVNGTVNLADTSSLTINTAYMPQWEMKLNGLDQPIKPNDQGLITTVNEVHSGENSVLVTWHRTTVENIGLFVSACSILVVIGLLII